MNKNKDLSVQIDCMLSAHSTCRWDDTNVRYEVAIKYFTDQRAVGNTSQEAYAMMHKIWGQHIFGRSLASARVLEAAHTEQLPDIG